MKSNIDHLPPIKQRQLARAQEILFEEFADALAGGTAEFKKRGRILKIILFGSYSRGGWVDEPANGTMSATWAASSCPSIRRSSTSPATT